MHLLVFFEDVSADVFYVLAEVYAPDVISERVEVWAFDGIYVLVGIYAPVVVYERAEIFVPEVVCGPMDIF